MRDKRKSTLKILEFLQQNMPIDDEEPKTQHRPSSIVESNAGANDLDKQLVQGPNPKRTPKPTPESDTVDPIVEPTEVANIGRKKKRLIDSLIG